MNKKTIAVLAISAVVIGAGAFFGGMKYEESQNLSLYKNFTGPMQGVGGNLTAKGSNMIGANRNGNSAVIGEVIAKDNKSLTIKSGNNGSKIVFYSTSTQLQKTTDATLEEVVVGKQVMVSGTTNSDGSLTASQIQLRSNLPAAGK